MSEELRVVSQKTKNGVCVVEFNTGLKARITGDGGTVEIKGMDIITDREFMHIASIRQTLKNG